MNSSSRCWTSSAILRSRMEHGVLWIARSDRIGHTGTDYLHHLSVGAVLLKGHTCHRHLHKMVLVDRVLLEPFEYRLDDVSQAGTPLRKAWPAFLREELLWPQALRLLTACWDKAASKIMTQQDF